MHFESIEFCPAESLAQFFDVLLKKKQVLRTTESTHSYHFVVNLPFSRGPSITGMIEEEDGVTVVVTLPIRRVFEEEDGANAWIQRNGAWFFTTWRRMLHDGQLVYALGDFFNRLDGDFARIPSRLAEVRKTLRGQVDEIGGQVESHRISDLGDEVDDAQAGLSRLLSLAEQQSKRMLWCRLFHVIGRYLKYDRSENS